MNTFSGLVHTARHTTRVGNTRSRLPNHLEGAYQGRTGDWGEVVTRYPYGNVRMDHLLSMEINIIEVEINNFDYSFYLVFSDHFIKLK